MDDGRLLLQTGRVHRPREEVIVDVQRRSHMYKYAYFMHINQTFLAAVSPHTSVAPAARSTRVRSWNVQLR